MTLFEPKTLLPGVPVGVPRALAEAAISAAQAGAGPVDGEQAAFGGPAGDGQAAFAGPIDEQAIAGAMQTLRRYRAGKAGLERRIVENEEYWKLRHWDHMDQTGTTALKTKSAWLVNVLLSKHADAMDAYPEPTCLPREPGDADTARLLSAVLPVVLGQNDFERVWSDNWWKKLKAGFAIYGVFWDRERLDGRGDIAICPVDPLNLYWEPGVTDLQDSKELFYVRLEDNETLLAAWPQLAGKLGSQSFLPAHYLYDDQVDTSQKTPVIDWYYHRVQNGRRVLHYVKFAAGTVLYATENEDPSDPDSPAVRGLYDHGRYPFFCDPLFPQEGTPGGWGYIDLCKDAQQQIDLMNNAIVANCVAAATPRWLKRGDDGINEAEYADWTRPFVHVQGSIEDSALRQITVQPLSGNYLSILESKIRELKETSGNRDVNNGGTMAGVTAASAIAALQEQSGKLSRDQIMGSYRCFRQVVGCVIELIRQFYDAPRQFRIAGGPEERGFLSLRGRDVPVSFDVEVTAQKQSAYSKLSYNELALQFFQLGFFNPALAPQALAALEMMDFKGKAALSQRIRDNALHAAQAAQQTQADAGADAAGHSHPTRRQAPRLGATDSLGNQRKRYAHTEQARARAAATTQPR